MLASRRARRSEHPADQYGLTSCESPIGTKSPPRHVYREAIAVVCSNTVLARAEPCRRLRRNAERARPTHGRPIPPHNLLRNLVHLVNPVKKNTPIAAPGRAHFDRSFPALIRFLLPPASCPPPFQKAIPACRDSSILHFTSLSLIFPRTFHPRQTSICIVVI